MITDTQGLSTDDVRKYLQRICEEAEGLMRDYDPRMILEWTDTNVVDGACFQVDVRVQKDGAHTGSIAMTLEKEDIMQFGGLFGAAAGKNLIADYRRKKPTPYMEKLHFSPSQGGTADPDARLLSDEDLKKAVEEGKRSGA